MHTCVRPINGLLVSRLRRPPAGRPSSMFVCASCAIATAASQPSQLDPTFTALATTPPPCGLVALPTRRLIALSGPDSTRFLQGATTQNILPSRGAAGRAPPSPYAAFLNATGRLLYDVFVYPDNRAAGSPGESFLVEVDAHQAAELERHIRRYKLRARFNVRLLDPGEVTVWHAWDDEGLRPALSSPTCPASGDSDCFAHVQDPRAPGLGYRMLKEGDQEPLVDLDRLVGDHVYRVRRYLMGVPEGQSELLREHALPLEVNLDVMKAIDFRKGCYVGQELTIRTKHRGVVRKRILPVMIYDLDKAETPKTLQYCPAQSGAVYPANSIPTETSIVRLGGKGRGAGKWLRGVGNIGLALCRLEVMTDVVLPGATTAASSYSPSDEFVMEQQAAEDEEGRFKLGVKAFIPDWLRQGLSMEATKTHGEHG